MFHDRGWLGRKVQENETPFSCFDWARVFARAGNRQVTMDVITSKEQAGVISLWHVWF